MSIDPKTLEIAKVLSKDSPDKNYEKLPSFYFFTLELLEKYTFLEKTEEESAVTINTLAEEIENIFSVGDTDFDHTKLSYACAKISLILLDNYNIVEKENDSTRI